MEDPLSALLTSLQAVFQLETIRNGKYTISAVQQLKESLEQYDSSPSKKNFLGLLKAIRDALPYLVPYIEKSRLHFDTIKSLMEEINQEHNLPPINWNTFLSHPKVSQTFQFSALNHSPSQDDLLVWITSKSGKPYAKLNDSELTHTLVNHREYDGFTQKLIEHLKKYPDFLFDLIMKSDKNFHKLCQSRLVLYLTDQQLAHAIIKYIPSLAHEQKDPHEQVASIIYDLNVKILSNGRSVSTILRSSEAKTILDNSVFFQIYQSDEYQNSSDISQQYVANDEASGLKQSF